MKAFPNGRAFFGLNKYIHVMGNTFKLYNDYQQGIILKIVFNIMLIISNYIRFNSIC